MDFEFGLECQRRGFAEIFFADFELKISRVHQKRRGCKAIFFLGILWAQNFQNWVHKMWFAAYLFFAYFGLRNSGVECSRHGLAAFVRVFCVRRDESKMSRP